MRRAAKGSPSLALRTAQADVKKVLRRLQQLQAVERDSDVRECLKVAVYELTSTTVILRTALTIISRKSIALRRVRRRPYQQRRVR